MEHILGHEKAHQKYFEGMTAISYGSYREQTCGAYLVVFAKEHGPRWIQDELYNVTICKDVSAGYEDHAPVLLQVHMDVVCKKNKDMDFDLERDALKLYIEDGFLKARGTALGVDDGAGVAYILALLSDPDAKHPLLKCVFTVQEEMGLFGVVALKKGHFQAERMINLDDGGENVICTTSVGGVNVTIQKERILMSHDGNGYQIGMFGLRGGHSGGEIDEKHGNANKLPVRVLFMPNRWYDVQLSRIQGGTEGNTIPREASAVFVCQADLETVAACAQEMKAILAKELEFDDAGVDVAVKEVVCDGVLYIEDSEEVIALLMTLLNGLCCHSMSIEGLNTASGSIDVMTAQKEAIIVSASLHGVTEPYVDALAMEMDVLTEIFGFHSEHEARCPTWSYRTDSPMHECLRTVCQEVLGRELQLVAVYGGLECSVFKVMDEDMGTVTIGPKIWDIHTPQEVLDLIPFDATFTLLRTYLKEL